MQYFWLRYSSLAHPLSGAGAAASASLPASSVVSFKLENTRAARLGVGASYVAHSPVNSALALGGKISGSIKRARSQKLEHEDEDEWRGRLSTDEHEDSKCASIKRKHGAAAGMLLDTGSLNKKKKKKKNKSTAVASESGRIDGLSLTVPHQQHALSHSKDAPTLIPADSNKLAQHSQTSSASHANASSAHAADDVDGTAFSQQEDLGSGLRNFHQGVRKRTKTRSKAKNLKKDKRPPELRPGGDK